jgi:hypothetical protein
MGARIIMGLCLATLAVTRASWAKDPPVTMEAHITWLDASKALPCPASQAVDTARRDLRALGVGTTWTRGTFTPSDLADARVYFLATPPKVSTVHPAALGAAPRGASRNAAVWVFWRRVGDAIGMPQDKGWLTVAECFEFARALGHVTAHEVIHVLAPEVPHSKEGLMAEAMGRSELLLPVVPLDAAGAAMLRLALRRPGERIATGAAADAEDQLIPD